MNNDVSIGRYLSSLRDKAGFKQNELAKRLEWSPAVLSRVESGDRQLAEGELEIILNGIGTAEALKAKHVIKRDWRILAPPPLDDIDADLLWEAEEVAKQISELAESPDVKQHFERRLLRYLEELSMTGQRVLNKQYRVALLGTIAVGKSTAICRAQGLEIDSSKGMPKAVLETGAGGITICEVHVRTGPGYGLIMEPCMEDQIRAHVVDFAKSLISPSPQDNSASIEGGAPGISREVERALRNITGLKKRKSEKRSDGTIVPARDDARELAQSVGEVQALAVEILARMELHKRFRRDIWYSDGTGKPPLDWLQGIFESVNNGRHAEFTIPRRIELVVPKPILGEESLSITLIDTQGIDDVAERADLEQHFDGPHTLVLLCTSFNEAPSTSVRTLLTRAIEGGVRTLSSHAAIVVLPRPGEALAVKDHDGYHVENAADGYAYKGDEVQLKLQPLGLSSLPTLFFNAAEDPREILCNFVKERIQSVREHHRATLREITKGATALLENYEKAQAEEIMKAASRRLEVWLANNREMSESSRHVHESLLAAVRSAHPRTVFASIVRNGEWQNLDYAHQLSHGARRVATQVVEPKLRSFKQIAENILQDDELAEAHDLVEQCVRVLEEGFDKLVRKVQLTGQSIQTDNLSEDDDFWESCEDEWGRGAGYRDRINAHNSTWFEDGDGQHADERVEDLIQDAWREALESVRELLSRDE